MLRYSRLIALALLMPYWQVAGDQLDGKIDYSYFGCHKNVDAVCSDRLPDGKQQRLTWAIRLRPGKRDYLCPDGTHPHCCWKDKYQDINDIEHRKLVPTGTVPYCQDGGQ
ncbi:hypothetical protein Pst134EA_022422 [Puccinia striiformis f. sp. tritici]|uniref:hypothetical protein n=1 Tax=Puccinia striiformis f. sp. tritici TaxID=168172 RepID=UPI002007C28B|nr:hypothetical protein Pst134EA_022422 [Puccinia striiformis f. sp. tritici]KAH9454934.1 hypothetical protein Pst134EA_022422 [Puccinia striiformis f. sp. tritici]